MEAGGSLATELLAGATLRDEEIPDGRIGLSWSALVLLPIKGRPQKTSLADCVGASAEHGTLLVHTVPLSGGGWLGKHRGVGRGGRRAWRWEEGEEEAINLRGEGGERFGEERR